MTVTFVAKKTVSSATSTILHEISASVTADGRVMVLKQTEIVELRDLLNKLFDDGEASSVEKIVEEAIDAARA